MKEPPKKTSAPERIRGIILRVTYQSPKDDYKVVKLDPEHAVDRTNLDKRGEVVVTGHLPGLEAGEIIEAEGEWSSHPKHGPQFRAQWFKPSLPTGSKGMQAYLASSVKGVGPKKAERIVALFGDRTFDVLDTQIDKLLQVKGINPRQLDIIKKTWAEARGDRELTVFLGDHGISPAWANRLRKSYGDAALSVVRSNPYRLAQEVRGVGFARADIMARKIGLDTDAPERIEAGLAHVLEDQASNGHTFLWKTSVIELAERLLDVDLIKVEDQLESMLASGGLVQENFNDWEAIFLPSLFEAESMCARSIERLKQAKRRVPKLDAETTLDAFETRTRFELAPLQRQAALTLAREGLMVLTGGPGTGKTTTLRAVIELFKVGSRQVKLAAPTGRAARRLSETTHMQAETIHRMLKYQPHLHGFAHNATMPIEADLIVIDEVSMLDAPLARDLFDAIAPGTCVLMVGDTDQLPSVGPGNVLQDLIATEAFPVVRLTEIFRQAQSSMIVMNAHRINRGELPQLEPSPDVAEPDFFFIERDDPADVLDTIRTLALERIPKKFGFDPVRDIQVLTPMRRGDLGVDSINDVLQAALNPSRDQSEKPAGLRQELRAGDRVMQTTNDYERGISNGDIGWVEKVDPESEEVFVRFEDRSVTYLADESRQLTLAYAATIHKSQGSEYRAVILPMHMQHFIMLRRNLIYTALTRARELVCIVGQKKAVWQAVRDVSLDERNSALGRFLKND